MLANVVAAVATIATDPQALYRDFGFVPDAPTWGSLFTSMFLHGHLWHLLGNMVFLWMFGDNVEDVLGAFGFLTVYFVSGMAAAGAHLVVESNSTLPLIGASGAVSGVVGVYFAFFPRSPSDLSLILLWWELKTWQVTTAAAVGAWFATQLVLGLAVTGTGLTDYVGIAFWAHVGGLLCGAALGAVLVRIGYTKRYTSSDSPRRNLLIGYVSMAGGPTGVSLASGALGRRDRRGRAARRMTRPGAGLRRGGGGPHVPKREPSSSRRSGR